MRNHTTLAALLMLGALGIGTLFAQPASNPPDLDPAQAEGERLVNDMAGIHTEMLRLQAAAHEAKDVVKLNCVNEKLIAVKALINIGEDQRDELAGATSSGDQSAQSILVRLQGTHGEVVAERDAARACVHENVGTMGQAVVTVQRPVVPDDPTDDRGPFNPTTASFDIERPAFATPW
jgi:hypothetical protein